MLHEKQILIKPVCRAKGGIHPPHNKKSANCPAKKIPLAPEIYIPMRQHIGAPCTPLVKAGDTVTLLVWRSGARLELTVTFDEKPHG